MTWLPSFADESALCNGRCIDTLADFRGYEPGFTKRLPAVWEEES